MTNHPNRETQRGKTALERITITIPLPAVPQGSHRATRRGGRLHVIETNPKHATFRQALTLALRTKNPTNQPIPPPYRVTITAAYPPATRPQWAWPTRQGDLDKITRTCCDALTQSGVIIDDRHITHITATKRYGDTPQTTLTIEHITDPRKDPGYF